MGLGMERQDQEIPRMALMKVKDRMEELASNHASREGMLLVAKSVVKPMDSFLLLALVVTSSTGREVRLFFFFFF
jgi:hypothetical protein